MKKLKPQIKFLLEANPKLRDDYSLLYLAYLAEKGILVYSMSYADVKKLEYEGYIKRESIVERESRMLQKDHPHLRGVNWEKNQKIGKEVRKTIKTL